MELTKERDSWEAFEGIEVEGRLRGVYTLFILNHTNIDPNTIPHGHIFILKEAMSIEGIGTWLKDVAARHIAITVETTPEIHFNIKRLVPPSTCFMVDMPEDLVDVIEDLGPDDMIRFGHYDLITFVKRMGISTHRDEYREDREWNFHDQGQ